MVHRFQVGGTEGVERSGSLPTGAEDPNLTGQAGPSPAGDGALARAHVD